MKKYRIEEYLDNVTSINESVIELFRSLNINPSIIFPSVKSGLNDSDFTAWSLFYGADKAKEIKEDIIKLLEIKVKDKPIFSVSGNGFGTGLSVTSNLGTKYD